MKKTPVLICAILCLSGAAFADAIFGAGDNNVLYTINPATGATVSVGNLGTTMYDIAEYGGKLYGINSAENSALYSINAGTAAVTDIGSTGQSFNAMTFGPTGILYAAGVGTTDLYTINLSTGAATKVAGETTQPAYNSAGDLQFIGNTLYMTEQTTGNSVLYTINLTTGAQTKVGTTNTGFDNVYGLAYSYGVLYGFTDNDGSSEVIALNTTTGVGTAVAGYGGTTRTGFGFDGTTSESAPEPSTLGVMALGLAGLAGTAYRRRKA
jgi:hypothetical protein